MAENLRNYIGGVWCHSTATEHRDVLDPATARTLARVPLSGAADVEKAVRAAAAAFEGWRQTPPGDRIQFLFRLKALLEENLEDLARTISTENGKTLDESRGEMRRAIENVEVACGIPLMMQSEFLEDVARGIDEFVIRQPLGVCAVIAPFNFPGMIAFWFLPYAIACGNTCIVKPSERVPLTMAKVFGLLERLGLPAGVVNMVHGAREAVDAILDHPEIPAISFVGSTAVARHVYARGAQAGKRVQAQGGAKNVSVVLPDADLEMTTRILADSAFGNAGQRCLATSLAITVGEARKTFADSIAAAAATRKVGCGLEAGVEMGPVISAESRSRIVDLVGRGEAEGAKVVVDGRSATIAGYEQGFFVRPTVLADVAPQGLIGGTEIFGPVLGLVHVDTVEQAIDVVNRSRYGNMACLFTSSGSAARRFRHEVRAGNVGINTGVAAPMAYFPFSGWKESFFGTLHGQGRHAVEFFTQTKVVVERWFEEWTRKF